MRFAQFTVFGLLGLGLLAGCSAGVDDAASADSVNETAETTSEAASAASASAGYVTVRRDARECAFPMCGGYWVKPVFGTANEAYAASLDFGKLALSADETSALTRDVGHLVLTGRVLGTPGAFIVDTAFAGRGATTAQPSAFYTVKSTPIVCFAAPCRNIEQTAVTKKAKVTMIASVDFSRIGGDTSDTNALLASATGLLVAGTPTTVRFQNRTAPGLVVTSYFAPVVHVAPPVVEAPLCDTRGAAPCAEGFFCSHSEAGECGYGDKPGRCAEKPAICTREFRPVCGCDLTTHSNPCESLAAGASVLHDGACTGHERE